MLRALDREAESLRSAIDRIHPIHDRLSGVRDHHLLALGFEELYARHDRLGTLRERLDRLATDRQTLVHGTTGHAGTAGLEHRPLLEYLYVDLETSYPVLSSIAHVERLRVNHRRRVRDQLSRRV